MGSPVWIGEFGAFMKDASSEQWLQDAVALLNERQIGWLGGRILEREDQLSPI